MGKAQGEFERLSAADRQAAIDGIATYRELAKSAGRTKLMAAVNYLKQRKWEDLDTERPPDAPYLPPMVPPCSALWTAALVDLLRSGMASRKRFVLKQLCERQPANLPFGEARDGELVEASARFVKARADSEAGRAFLAWLDHRLAALNVPHLMPRFPDDFWLYLPPDDLARAWGYPWPASLPTHHSIKPSGDMLFPSGSLCRKRQPLTR
jgi:hypothetical protein